MKLYRKVYFNLLFSLYLAGIAMSCTEIYDPEINAPENILVVNALITDQPGPYKISLNYAQPFDSTNAYKIIHNAEVFVLDNHGNRFDFRYSGSGEYHSDQEQFQGDTSSIYTLTIITRDNEVYRSDSVQMVKSSYSTSAYGLFTKKQFLVEGNYNEMLVEEKDWVSIYLNTFITGDEVPGIRFEPQLVVFSLYILDPEGSGDSKPFYAWRTFYQDFQLVSDDLIQSAGPEGELAYYDREISSFEYREFIKARDFQMPIDTINSRILWYGLLLKQYQMNSSSALFYGDLAKQVQSENRIFDPLPLDVRGNIRCITNTSRPVIGLFEVSAAQMTAYKVITRKDASEVVVSPVEFMAPEPPLGSVPDIPPDFWIN